MDMMRSEWMDLGKSQYPPSDFCKNGMVLMTLIQIFKKRNFVENIIDCAVVKFDF